MTDKQRLAVLVQLANSVYEYSHIIKQNSTKKRKASSKLFSTLYIHFSNVI